MLRTGAIALLALAMFGAGCSAPESQSAEDFEMIDPDRLAIPEPMTAQTPFDQGFLAGASARLVLDSCPDDPAWTTDTGPIGSLKCGGSYSVFYVPETEAWVVVGPNLTLEQQGAARTDTAAGYVGEPPATARFRAWGLTMSWDEAGAVQTSEGVRIGRLLRAGEGNDTPAVVEIAAPPAEAAMTESPR